MCDVAYLSDVERVVVSHSCCGDRQAAQEIALRFQCRPCAAIARLVLLCRDSYRTQLPIRQCDLQLRVAVAKASEPFPRHAYCYFRRPRLPYEAFAGLFALPCP